MTIIVSKFTTGAWIPVVVIPLIVLGFRRIRSHYDHVRDVLRVGEDWRPPPREHTVIVLVSRVHRGVLDALAYARSLAPDHLLALHVAASEEEAEKVQRQWDRQPYPVELDVIVDPYRRLSQPVLDYIEDVDDRWSDDVVTVVVPEFVVGRWWGRLLHNQSATFLRARLRSRPHTVVVSVPLHLEHPEWDEPGPRTDGPGRREHPIGTTHERGDDVFWSDLVPGPSTTSRPSSTGIPFAGCRTGRADRPGHLPRPAPAARTRRPRHLRGERRRRGRARLPLPAGDTRIDDPAPFQAEVSVLPADDLPGMVRLSMIGAPGRAIGAARAIAPLTSRLLFARLRERISARLVGEGSRPAI